MSLQITSPAYSFVTLDETAALPDIYEESEFAIPVYDPAELIFQIKATTDRPDLIEEIKLFVGTTIVGDFEWYLVGEEYIGISRIAKTAAEIIAIAGLNCFELQIVYNTEDHPDNTGFESGYLQNSFQIVEGRHYTSLLQYYNDCPEFDFVYSDAQIFYNQIRLPITLHALDPVSNTKGYRKSTGAYKRLSTVMNKTWTLDGDYMTERQIMCLTVAIAHNNILLRDERNTWHNLFMPDGETLKTSWVTDPGEHFRKSKVNWKMLEDFEGSISNLCGACDTYFEYYDQGPIGGDIPVQASAELDFEAVPEEGDTFTIHFPESGEVAAYDLIFTWMETAVEETDLQIVAANLNLSSFNFAQGVASYLATHESDVSCSGDPSPVTHHVFTAVADGIYDGVIGNGITLNCSNAAIFTQSLPLNLSGGSD